MGGIFSGSSTDLSKYHIKDKEKLNNLYSIIDSDSSYDIDNYGCLIVNEEKDSKEYVSLYNFYKYRKPDFDNKNYKYLFTKQFDWDDYRCILGFCPRNQEPINVKIYKNYVFINQIGENKWKILQNGNLEVVDGKNLLCYKIPNEEDFIINYGTFRYLIDPDSINSKKGGSKKKYKKKKNIIKKKMKNNN